jgi:hypothetical protein
MREQQKVEEDRNRRKIFVINLGLLELGTAGFLDFFTIVRYSIKLENVSETEQLTQHH